MSLRTALALATLVGLPVAGLAQETDLQTYTIAANGRVTPSGMVILQDRRGLRDTVSVQASGLVTVR